MNQPTPPPEEPSLKVARFGCAALIAIPFLIAIAYFIHLMAGLAT